MVFQWLLWQMCYLILFHNHCFQEVYNHVPFLFCLSLRGVSIILREKLDTTRSPSLVPLQSDQIKLRDCKNNLLHFTLNLQKLCLSSIYLCYHIFLIIYENNFSRKVLQTTFLHQKLELREFSFKLVSVTCFSRHFPSRKHD